MILQSIESFHLKPQEVDDNYSKRVYDLFLDRMDPNKQIFTWEDIKKLKPYLFKLDEDLESGNFAFLNLSFELYQSQLSDIQTFINENKSTPVQLQSKDSVLLNPKHKKAAKSKLELHSRWMKLIRYETLQNYIKQFSEKNKDTEITSITLDDTLLKEAHSKAIKSFERRLKQLEKVDKKEFTNRFFDVVAQSHGPHSSYLPPAEKENFDIGMTGRLEGIGAVLREDDGHIKIVRIIPGSASWRQKELKAEDIILKVGQGDKEPVDLVEMPVNDAVKYIRGKKRHRSKTNRQKPDGTIKVIPIISRCGNCRRDICKSRHY